MKMMHPCLMTGPFDWSEDLTPRAEFDARLALVRECMKRFGVDRLVVHGNPFDHGALAWLTNFTPKLGLAFALVSLEGPMRIVFSGGPGMKPSAKRLTFVEDVAAFRGVDIDIGKWLDEGHAEPLRLGVCEGTAVAQAPWRALAALAEKSGAPVEMDAEIDTLRRSKSRVELNHVSSAIEILDKTTQEMLRLHGTLGRRDAMVAAERAAMKFGAQDARLRFSNRPYGLPAPFDDDNAFIDGPMRAVIAVRYSGYWATGEFMLGEMPQAFQRQACAAMELALSRVRAGATRDQICAAIDGCDIVCHGIGLSFEEAPFIERDDALREGDVINLVVTLRIAEGQSAAWSAMARVEKSSARVLWTAPDIKRSAETVSARRRD